MCFSNLPVEFDENGDPHLAEEADDVERLACGCPADADVALDETDPREAYDAIVETLPEGVRRHLEDADADPDGVTDAGREEARSD